LHLDPHTIAYRTGFRVSGEGGEFQAYADSIRSLSTHIDLREIWELVREEAAGMTAEEIAELYWEGEMDASRWAALSIHLDAACPFFGARHGETFVPLSDEEVEARQYALEGRQAVGEEREEFVYWLAAGNAEPYDPETLTRRQQHWLEEIREYAIWGSEAGSWKHARKLLSEVTAGSGDLQRRAFNFLVEKGIWEEDENLDLIRHEVVRDWPEEALQMAEEIDLNEVLSAGGRHRLRGRRPFVLSSSECELAVSVRRRWPLLGYEVGVHFADVACLVPPGSALDRAASDRMGAIRLPDGEIPMLPDRLAEDLARPTVGEGRPTASILMTFSRRLDLKGVKIVPSALTCRRALSAEDASGILNGERHALRKELLVLDRLATKLRAERERAGAMGSTGIPELRVEVEGGDVQVRGEDLEAPGARILRELSILAERESGAWCAARGIPTIYETQDAVPGREALEEIPDPHVRRHELRRQRPPVTLSGEPGIHRGLGVSGLCPMRSPAGSYPALMIQRQVLHYAQTGEILHSSEEMDLVRYRAQEELVEHEGMRRLRERYWVLKDLSKRAGQSFEAVVLYLRRDGALVEMVDYPLKCPVHPTEKVSVGDTIQVQVSGVDLWRLEAHFTA
jgi:exoribonuclease R